MSPDEAWHECQPKDSDGKVIGMEYLPEDLHWLFDHREIRHMGRNGIRLPYCGGKYYKGGDSGKFYGNDVVVYFDPEKQERIYVSDLKGEQFGIVPLDTAIPRWSATGEEFEEANRRIKEHDSYARMLWAEIKSNYKAPRRKIVADPRSWQIGRKMKQLEQDLSLSQANRREELELQEFMERERRLAQPSRLSPLDLV